MPTLVSRSLTGWLDDRTSTRCVTSEPEIGAQEMPPRTGFPTSCHGCSLRRPDASGDGTCR